MTALQELTAIFSAFPLFLKEHLVKQVLSQLNTRTLNVAMEVIVFSTSAIYHLNLRLVRTQEYQR